MDEQPIGTGLNRNLGSPTAPGDAVERQLDAFISKRQSSVCRLRERAWPSRCDKRVSGLTRRGASRWRLSNGTPSIAGRPKGTAAPWRG